jgi:hypothetical protein
MVLSPPEENSEEEDCQFDPTIPEPNLSLHLLAMMDLFILYNKCFPHTLDIPNSMSFLTHIEQIMAHEEDHEAVAVVQERVLQLLIALDSFAFTPDKVNTISIFILFLEERLLGSAAFRYSRREVYLNICKCKSRKNLYWQDLLQMWGKYY